MDNSIFSGFYSNLESNPPGSLNWTGIPNSGFLIILLPFRFIFCIGTFYEVALSEWKKKEPKSLREVYATSPEPRSMVALPLPVLWVDSCSGPETAAIREGWAPPIRAKQEGPSTQLTGKRGHCAQLVSLQKRGGIFHIILFSCTHMPRK